MFTYPLDTSPAFLKLLASRPPNLRLLSFYLNRQLLAPYLNVIDRMRVPDDKDLTSFTPRPPELRPEDYAPARVSNLLGWMRQAAVQRVLTLDRLDHPDLAAANERRRGPSGRQHPGLRARPPGAIRLPGLRRSPCAFPGRGLGPGPETGVRSRTGRRLRRRGRAGSPGCTGGQVRSLRDRPASRAYAVSRDGPGFLVERENFARGWRAEVDGRPSPVLRANGKHRAVAVPPGAHEVVLHYVAPGLREGVLLTVLSLIATAFFLARPPLS